MLEAFMRGRARFSPASTCSSALGLRLRELLERRGRVYPLPPREGGPPLRADVARDGSRPGYRHANGVVSPIRARLTLAFAVAMAAVLAATGASAYLRLQSSFRRGDRGGARRASCRRVALRGQQARPAVAPTRRGSRRLSPERSPRCRATASSGTRTRGTTVDIDLGRRTVLVGASFADRDEALSELLTQLLIIAPIALLLTSLLGYWIAGAALRPVEEMRAEAAAIPIRAGPPASGGGARDEIALLAKTLNEMLRGWSARSTRAELRRRREPRALDTPRAAPGQLELALRKPRNPGGA